MKKYAFRVAVRHLQMHFFNITDKSQELLSFFKFWRLHYMIGTHDYRWWKRAGLLLIRSLIIHFAETYRDDIL